MPGRQITSRVRPEIKDGFTAYAAQHGFSDSELAKLIFLRERHQMQLKSALLNGTLILAGGQASSKSKLPTITAHYSSSVPVEEFLDHVRSCSPHLSRSVAAAWLLERELAERWLSRALALPPAMP